jgi:integrase
MSTELFTFDGKRKYLSRQELDDFILAAHTLERPEVRTLALVLAHTGCRLSEALALTAQSIDISQGVIVFQTLKQREALRYRAVPLSDTTLDALELVHRLRKTQKSKAMETTRNPRLVQKWLGHRSLETTAIYMDLAGSEERQAAEAMWN